MFGELKQRFAALAVHRPVEVLVRELHRLPFEPYAPVRDQLRILLRAVNRRRSAAGLECVPLTALRLRRRSVSPFGEGETDNCVVCVKSLSSAQATT